jgi:hypothetical protein
LLRHLPINFQDFNNERGVLVVLAVVHRGWVLNAGVGDAFAENFFAGELTFCEAVVYFEFAVLLHELFVHFEFFYDALGCIDAVL